MFTQILLDHGFGAAGVAINSAPTEGVKVVPLSQVKATFPVLKNPANRHKAVGFTLEQWHYAFTNTFSEEESRALYERYHIPASGAIFWGSALANIQPGHEDTYVDYDNDDRAPLLFISGSEDHLMPPTIQQSNAKHYKSDTVTEVKEYEGSAPAARAGGLGGDRRLRARLGARATRAMRPPAPRRVKDVRLTHIGGPDRADRGRRLAAAHRPDVRPPRPEVLLRLGHVSRKLAGPAIAAADLPPIDAVLLTHDHHGDNLDPAGPRAAARRRASSSPRRPGARRLGGGARGLAAVGRRRRSRRRAGRRSRSPRRRAATARRSATRSSATSSASRCAGTGQEHGVLWISGDTVLYDGVREVAGRLRVDVALLHLGGVQFPVTGPAALHDDRRTTRSSCAA